MNSFSFEFVPNEECKDFHNNMENLDNFINNRIKKIKDVDNLINPHLQIIKYIHKHNQDITNDIQKIKDILDHIQTITDTLGKERYSATIATVSTDFIKITRNHIQISWKDLFKSAEYSTKKECNCNILHWCTCGKIPKQVIIYILLNDIKLFDIKRYKDYLGMQFDCDICNRECINTINIDL